MQGETYFTGNYTYTYVSLHVLQNHMCVGNTLKTYVTAFTHPHNYGIKCPSVPDDVVKINFEYVVLLFRTSSYFSRRRTTFHDVVLLFTTSYYFSRRRTTFHDVVLLFKTSYYFSRRRPTFHDVVLLFKMSSCFRDLQLFCMVSFRF